MKKIILLISLFFVLATQTAWAEEKQKEKEEKSDQMIIINKAVNKLAFYEDGRLVHVFSVATGASASATPEGDFHVNVKWECPIYYKGKNGPCETGNPLGPRWIGLDVPGTAGYTYGIHGNASAWSIGTYASAGCVRMHNWQVTQLFDIVKYNTPVTIIRSNKGFDQIAKEKGYNVVQANQQNERVTIVGKANGHYGSHEGLVLEGEVLENQEVNMLETIGLWKKVETLKDKKTYWVNTENIVGGKVQKEKRYVLMEEKGLVYTYPKENSEQTSMKQPRILESILHTGDWHYVTLDNGKNGWIKLSNAKEVSQKEWDTQQNMPRYVKEWMEKWQEVEKTPTEFALIVKELFS